MTATTGTGYVDQSEPRIAADSLGGAIVIWDDPYNANLYAQRFVADGPVAVEVSLASVEAQSDHVDLVWNEAGDRAPATVYRRKASSEWTTIARLDPDGEGMLRYEDRDVTPGTRYGYRLGYNDGGTETFTSETWVQVPALRLSLEGLRPNPATGPLSVSFVLPSAAPATLEVLDVSGRRLVQREVGGLGAGAHLVRLDEGALLQPGVYWLRLRQGDQTLVARGAIVR